MSRLVTRLRFLVRGTRDPWVVAYVAGNLQTPRGCTNNELGQEYGDLLMRMIWAPAGTERELVNDALGDKGALFAKREFAVASKVSALKSARSRLKDAETQALIQKFVKDQLEVWSKEQAKLEETLNVLYHEFKYEDTLGIVVRLKDEEPLNRWMAIQMAMRRWDKVENFLVEMLDDPVPMVRQAAHQALVQFARGADHGPFGGTPTRDQVRVAQKSWRAYMETQDAPGAD
ncbi:MAG: HEAT repeat domain-containing protein [Gemmataceae bacterium]